MFFNYDWLQMEKVMYYKTDSKYASIANEELVKGLKPNGPIS